MSSRLLGLLVLAFLAAPALTDDDAPRVDAFGDPLPDGIVARLGSTRLLHAAKIAALAFTAGGDLVASGAMDGNVQVWSAVDGTGILAKKLEEGGVRTLDISAEGERIAVGSTSGYSLVWDVLTGEQLLRVDGGAIAAISPDGRTLAVSGSGGEVKLVRIDEEGAIVVEGRGYEPSALVFSPDGELVAKTVWNRGRVEESEEVTIEAALDVLSRETGELLWRQTWDRPRLPRPAFPRGGAELLVVDADGKLIRYDARTGEVLGEGPAVEECIYAAAAGDRVVALSSAENRAFTWTDEEDSRAEVDTDGQSATACAVSADGSTLALGLGREVCVWDLQSRLRRVRFDRHVAPVSALAWSTDGSQVLSGSFTGEVRVWDAASSAPLATLPGCQGQVFGLGASPDGARFGAADWSGNVFLWNAETLELLAAFGESAASVTGFAFSPDGKRVACASTSGVLRVIDVETGEQVARGEDLQGTVILVAFSPDGERLAVAGRNLLVVDAATGEELRRWERLGSPPGALAWSPDGAHVAVGLAAKEVRLYDPDSDAPPRVLPGHDGRVAAVAFTPSGDLLLAGGYGSSDVRLWDVATVSPAGTLEGYSGEVLALAVSPDGRHVAVGGVDPNSVVIELPGAAAPAGDG